MSECELRHAPEGYKLSFVDPNTINVPLQGTDFGDAHYIAVMHSLVLPLIAQLKPALILVSCG